MYVCNSGQDGLESTHFQVTIGGVLASHCPTWENGFGEKHFLFLFLTTVATQPAGCIFRTKLISTSIRAVGLLQSFVGVAWTRGDNGGMQISCSWWLR